MRDDTLIVSSINPQFKFQGPRFKRLGPGSGEEFRDDYLIPWILRIKGRKQAVIDFAGTLIFTPSFLEEAFGGAVRKGHGKAVRKIKFLNMPEYWEAALLDYISQASFNSE